MHFGILKMIASSGFLTALECTKFDFGRGSAPDSARGAYSAPPDSLAGLKGTTSKGRAGKGTGKEGRGQMGRGRRGTGNGGVERKGVGMPGKGERRGGKRGRKRGGKGRGGKKSKNTPSVNSYLYSPVSRSSDVIIHD